MMKLPVILLKTEQNMSMTIALMEYTPLPKLMVVLLISQEPMENLQPKILMDLQNYVQNTTLLDADSLNVEQFLKLIKTFLLI